MSEEEVRAWIQETKAAAGRNERFSEAELDKALGSLRSLAGPHAGTVDWTALRELLASAAHEPHKEWSKTERAAETLAGILGGPDGEAFRSIFQRVLEDGHWDAAAAAAAARPADAKPWAVLVTGVNGIRKTTTIYQKWFKDVLSQALAAKYPDAPAKEELPDGNNSFFRQLDYMIATVANEDFRNLYRLEDIDLYAALKDGIFTRFRTIAEIVGILLVKEGQKRRMNVMVETSGRDVAMFRYVDHLFPDTEYRKLVVHFTINDLSFAERSVDTRMQREMRNGRAAVAAATNPMDVIRANAGGPYGSKVLQKVQAEAQSVWESVSSGEAGVAESWYKASIAISARADAEWTVRALGPAAGEPGGQGLEDFVFAPP